MEKLRELQKRKKSTTLPPSKAPKLTIPAAPSATPASVSVEDKPDVLPELLDRTPKQTFTETALGLPVSPLSSPEHKTEPEPTQPTQPPTQPIAAFVTRPQPKGTVFGGRPRDPRKRLDELE